MAKKEKIGLYLGVNSVAASLLEAKKIVTTSCTDISSDQDSIESLQENVRIQASLNKILREAHIEGKNINLSLADRNFIFRYLELPLMGKKDLESSLFFEIEKYIPFKAEELLWDYQYVQSKSDKKTKVSFIGIRTSNYNRVKDILSQLDLSLEALEPASISLARLVKSSKVFSKNQHFAILDVTDYEGYLTFFQNELPVFNRHFDISKSEGEFDKEKFIEAVNYSFQYFRREYKKSDIEKIIVIGDVVDDQTVVSLKETLGLDVEKVVSSDLFSYKKQLAIEEIKALGVAQRENINYKFKPILKKREKEIVAEKSSSLDFTTGWRYGVLSSVAVVGAIACFSLWLHFNFKVLSKEENLIAQRKNMKIVDNLKGFSRKQIDELVTKKKNQISYIKGRESTYSKIWPFLRFLEQKKNIPDHLWLESLNIKLTESDYKGRISGYVYFQDSVKESKAVDKFVNNLKSNKDIANIFSGIQLDSVRKMKLNTYPVTSFDISLDR
ncbi:MAG: pilus assembly protein PilM [Candidatus Omnitrophica bacterium]|nr:pilus assembly protein PilM [Candidatus Omnitrophota bacterium]MCF7894420.1 pilus assembly protein PilM [Candidatus Omnitrophota bacterium]